jgi:hypothetical protein
MSRQGERVPLKTKAGLRDVIMMKELAALLRSRKLAARFSADHDLVIGNGVGRTPGDTACVRHSAARLSELVLKLRRRIRRLPTKACYGAVGGGVGPTQRTRRPAEHERNPARTRPPGPRLAATTQPGVRKSIEICKNNADYAHAPPCTRRSTPSRCRASRSRRTFGAVRPDICGPVGEGLSRCRVAQARRSRLTGGRPPVSLNCLGGPWLSGWEL